MRTLLMQLRRRLGWGAAPPVGELVGTVWGRRAVVCRTPLHPTLPLPLPLVMVRLRLLRERMVCVHAQRSNRSTHPSLTWQPRQRPPRRLLRMIHLHSPSPPSTRWGAPLRGSWVWMVDIHLRAVIGTGTGTHTRPARVGLL